MRVHLLRIARAMILSGGIAACQSTPPVVPTIEAVDVHLSAPGETPSGRFMMPGGRFEFYATTVQMFIRIAWNVDEDRIAGGPSWMDTDRFDLIAKMAMSAPIETERLVLQSILADRFGLSLHTEERPLPVFVLNLGRRTLLKETSHSDELASCQRNETAPPETSMTCRNMTMAGLAAFLPGAVGPDLAHPVVDHTGLAGAYDFTISWTPRSLNGLNGGTSIFDAVERQLGLRIEEGRAPLKVLVVDHANHTPTANMPNISSVLAVPSKDFEVATVKQDKSGDSTPPRIRVQPNGRVEAMNYPLRDLIALAWNIEPERVLNGDKWLETDRYDVIGTGGMTGSIDVIRQMLRGVLTERFKLTVHREDRSMTVFGIEQSKRGVKLKESAGDSVSTCKVSDGDTQRFFTCTNTTMSQFAERLHPITPNSLPHPLIDLTGLRGAYDFVLSWTRPIGPGQLVPASTAAPAAGTGQSVPTADNPNGVITLADAFEHELGLRVSEQKHPIPVIMIDHINRTPTEN